MARSGGRAPSERRHRHQPGGRLNRTTRGSRAAHRGYLHRARRSPRLRRHQRHLQPLINAAPPRTAVQAGCSARPKRKRRITDLGGQRLNRHRAGRQCRTADPASLESVSAVTLANEQAADPHVAGASSTPVCRNLARQVSGVHPARWRGSCWLRGRPSRIQTASRSPPGVLGAKHAAAATGRSAMMSRLGLGSTASGWPDPGPAGGPGLAGRVTRRSRVRLRGRRRRRSRSRARRLIRRWRGTPQRVRWCRGFRYAQRGSLHHRLTRGARHRGRAAGHGQHLVRWR